MMRTILLLMITLTLGCSTVKGDINDGVPVSLLEIHVIHVEQGDATLILGPNHITLLIDGGNAGKGVGSVVPYLKKLGIRPVDGIDYMVATHLDADHIGGLDEVIKAGYNIKKKIWFNGSNKTGTVAIDQFFNTATTTTAATTTAMLLGEVIDLGNSAKATVVAVGGKVIGSNTVYGTDENDKSIALLIQYGGFDYITAGDLGGGEPAGDAVCTGRSTTQADVETPLANAMRVGLLGINGVEVMHVNHHGSESSTNYNYMNLLTPKVAIIQTGSGQDDNYQHPRKDVVENVLGKKGNCISAPAALVLQTGEGNPIGEKTSTDGFVVGDIIIRTSGAGSFEVNGSDSAEPNENAAAGISGQPFPYDP
ncbi:MAG: MBL fold metallo-hydrolase [Nitrospirota bacterium]